MSPQSILSCKSNRLPPRKARPVFRSDSNHRSSAKKNKKSSAILPGGTRQGNNKEDVSTHFVLDEEDKENPFYVSLSPEAKIPYSTSPSKVSSLSTKVNPFAMNGAWHKYEGLAFLEGLEKCGTGKWKKICRYVPTRDNIQIKSRAQQVLKKEAQGAHIFEDLREFRREQSLKYHHSIRARALAGGFYQGHPTLAATPRSASDVLHAACGLAMLEEQALVFPNRPYGHHPLVATRERFPQASIQKF